jgi:hypothetical protein
MKVLVETTLCLALAVAIVLLVLVPLHRHRRLPERIKLGSLSSVVLVISPIGAALVTCGLIVLFGVFSLILMLIGGVATHDLLATAKASLFEYAPPFVQGTRSWQVLIAIYVICFITLLAHGMRVLIRHSRPSRS